MAHHWVMLAPFLRGLRGETFQRREGSTGTRQEGSTIVHPPVPQPLVRQNLP